MGKLSKRFNKKARQTSQTVSSVSKVDDEIKKIVEHGSEDEYKSTKDESNYLVVSKKNKDLKVKKCNDTTKSKTVLSKKQRKKLQRIVEQKHKKEKVCEHFYLLIYIYIVCRVKSFKRRKNI